MIRSVLLGFLIALFAAGLMAAVATPAKRIDPRAFALRIVSATATQGSICSATAVGPDEIETAAHCLSYPLRLANDKPATLVRAYKVTEDRVRAKIAGVRFDAWATPGKAVQGQRVRFWGQPHGRPFVYREGAVVAVYPDGLLLDVTVCSGDSGSGVFDDAGRLVGVVSFMTDDKGCTFAGAR